MSDHIVQLFDTVGSLASSAAAFLADGFRRGDTLLVVARSVHWRATVKRLQRLQCPVQRLLASRRLVVLDGPTTLASFMRRGQLHVDRFHDVVGGCVSQLAEDGGHLRVYGEMVDILAEEANLGAAQELETLWDDLCRRFPLTLLCGYASAHFTNGDAADALDAICGLHARVRAKTSDALGNWLLKSVGQLA